MADQRLWRMTDKWDALSHTPPAWLKARRFGLFFHWGPYSVPACGNEWYSRNMYDRGSMQNRWHEAHFGPVSQFGYKDLIPRFTGEHFDAEAWASLVQESGAGFGGPVSEHADNFSMWDSRVNPVNARRMGPKRDIVGACAEAFRKKDLKFLGTLHHSWFWGWFMSSDPEADVYVPENRLFYGPSLPLEANRYAPYTLPDKAFCDTWLEKVKELSQGYRPDMLYFDSRLLILPEETLYKAAKAYYDAVPEGIISYKQTDFPDALGLHDVELGRFRDIQKDLWQTDDRLEDQVTWCYVEHVKYKSSQKIIQQLADVSSKNGSLLLNVGPMADGRFHPDAVEALHAVGGWLKAYGEAIYDTDPFEVPGEGVTQSTNEDYNPERLRQQMRDGVALESGAYRLTAQDVRYTRRSNQVYCIGFGMPEDGTLCLKALAAHPVRAVHMVGTEIPVAFSRGDRGLQLHLPAQAGLFAEGFALRITLEGEEA